jgi:class 3 adenylate cyclase
MRISCIGARLTDADGTRLGTLNVYTPALPSSVLDLLARGDERMFERMSRLVEPGRRAAAILFADLQASGTLSRRLPSAAYFRLISELTTAVDAVIVELEGIVGKHAGDGVTALFLADEVGSPSRAARAAIAAAQNIATACADIATEFAEEAPGIGPEDVRMNVGLHWGGGLYVGQIVTGGRLEVTALGDEVNECARIQQAARDGSAYASKALLEQLEPTDATAAGVDPDAVAYQTVAELPGADEKSVRDAGGIAVARLA